MKYISQEIKQSVIRASSGTVVLLEAPVGSGKTTFCIKDLWMHCRMNQKKMLLLVNRSALRGQLRVSILETLKVPVGRISEDKLLEVDGLTITSYQYLQEILRNKSFDKNAKVGAIRMHQFNYVIADEIHYLLTDSQFSPATGAFRLFPKMFPMAVRVYVSATLRPVRSLILELEEVRDLFESCENEWARKLLPYRYMQQGLCEMIAPGIKERERHVIEINDVAADYSRFNPIFYEESTRLEEIIKAKVAGGDSGKWLVFVATLEEGLRMKKNLIEAGISASFITADHNADVAMGEDDRKVKEMILFHQRFEVQVLLATTVIDNGVSIIDPKTTHLVLTGYELIQAIQQAGRIRVRGKKQKIELYICRHTAEFFNRCQYSIREKLRICRIFSDESQGGEKRRMDYLMNKCDNLLWDVIRTGVDGKYYLNTLAQPALEYFFQQLQENKELVQRDSNGFILKVLNWFGLPYSAEGDLLVQREEQAMKRLEEFLLSNLSKQMKTPEWNKFREGFRELYEATGKGILCSGRSERLVGVAKVKEILRAYNYDLMCNHKTYTVVEVDS